MTGHYVRIPAGWEHEEPDPSVGIMADGMTHLACLDGFHDGNADLTGGCGVGKRLPGGYQRFAEEWKCIDCGAIGTFLVDHYIGWDQPTDPEADR